MFLISLLQVMLYLFIIIILAMAMLIVMKIILILSHLLDFWLGILNLRNVKHLKRVKWRIYANSMASQKMVEFWHVRRSEKRNRTDFYWVMLLMYTVWKYLNIFTIKTWYSFSYLIFGVFCLKIYIKKYLKVICATKLFFIIK